MYKILLTTLCCSLFFLTSVNAQKYKGQRFKVGALVAGNAAQIDGDRVFGYRRFGAEAGIQGIAMLNKTQYLSLEFLISQRGSITAPDEVATRGIAYSEIRLNYIEIPILYNIKLPLVKSQEGAYFYTGIAVSRLLGGSVGGVNNPKTANPVILLKNRTSEFKTFEIDYIVGANYFFTKNWGVTIRHTVGLTQFYKPTAADILEDLKPMRNLFVTVGAVYVLN